MPDKKKMQKLRELIVRGASSSKEGHVPSALSILDILWVIYDKVLRINAENPEDPNRDYFILSKGHASLGLYAVLVEKGLIKKEELDNFCSFYSPLGGHPDRNKIPWVEASTGSLGHGFPISVGVALGIKIKKGNGRVITVIGDGECNEGTIWESAMLASHHKLNNLCCIVDYNHSTDRALDVGDLVDKFRAFGWNSMEVDGHDQEKIYDLLKNIPKEGEAPTAIIANTIKGYGIKSMENTPAWHHKAPSFEELDQLLEEIKQHD